VRGHQVAQCSGTTQRGKQRSWWRAGARRATALSAVLVVGVLAAAGLSASSVSAATIVSFSAKSGQFGDGRLLVRGVSGRARYVTDAGQSGRMSLTRLHRRVFLPGKPPTGMLHIAGRDDDLTFKLSRPRYNPRRQTVSYAAKPLPGTPLSDGVAHRAPLQFGDASLTVLPHPALAVGDNGGHDCIMMADTDLGGENLTLQSSSNWNTDTWPSSPPGQFPNRHTDIHGVTGRPVARLRFPSCVRRGPRADDHACRVMAVERHDHDHLHILGPVPACVPA
jgi:hypothetical protein